MTTNDQSHGLLIARLDRVPVVAAGACLSASLVSAFLSLLRYFRHQRLVYPDLHPNCLHVAIGSELYRPAAVQNGNVKPDA